MKREDENSEEVVHKSRYLSFFVEEEQYGIEISHINEIIAMMKITHVPRTPDFVEGVINLRGSIIPIVDIRGKFGIEKAEHDMNTAIIINEVVGVNIGFIVDRVEDVLILDDRDLSEPPKFGSHIDTSFIRNVAEVDKNVILILDMEKIFEEDELTKISEYEDTKTNTKENSDEN
ncbi:MAG: chemotaxis protein CheW [Campylobacterota bacterium]|nr:chemotaxis protein CheW [Campylobacterota bacterium]